MVSVEMEKAPEVVANGAAHAENGSASANTSPVKESNGTTYKEAMSHFVNGKRCLLVKDLNTAVDSFSKACELLSEEYGENSYEGADASYYYGKALLELARAEAGVLGNALDGVPDGEDSDNSQVEDPEKMTEEERETVEKEVGEALDENYAAMEEKMKNKGQAESTEEETEDEEKEEGEGNEVEMTDAKAADGEAEAKGEPEKSDKAEEAKKADEPEKEGDAKDGQEPEKEVKDTESVGGADAEDKEGEDQKEQEAEEEEDPSNLQLAWEMLEIAKVSYEKHLASLTDETEKKAVEAKLCETLLTLGEVSLESENYEQAVADITDCLEKRKATLPEDSRRIAETLYQLGLAQGLDNKFEESVKTLEEAVAVIKKRIDNLKNKTESPDESKSMDAFYTRESEITELEALLPEIREKIQDTKDSKDQVESNKKEEEGFSKGGEGSGAKPVSSIAIKRKAEGGDSVSPKKAHIENGTSAAAETK